MLRGFYFTGVQAVFVDGAAPEYQRRPQQQAQAAGVRSRDGGVRRRRQLRRPPPRAAAPRGGARKVPRWDFLPRVMREVVFGDKAAVRLTSAGARVGFWRTVGLGVVIVRRARLRDGVRVLVSAATSSCNAARSTRRAASRRSRRIRSTSRRSTRSQKLDALRMQVDTLSAYEHDGAPIAPALGTLLRHRDCIPTCATRTSPRSAS